MSDISFNVRLTHNCNMSCSFCVAKEEMKENVKTNVSENLLNYLKNTKHNVTSFIISGGEPMLKKQRLEDVINVILDYKNDVPILILTNATMFDKNYVETFNSFDNISFIISISSINKGEKSLLNLIKKAPLGARVVPLIKELKRKSIKVVVDNFKDDFELEILSLISIFACKIDISLNTNNLKKLDIEDTYVLMKSICRFKALGIYENISFGSFFSHTCDCTKEKSMFLNGKIEEKGSKHANDYLSSGCSSFSNIMGEDLYKVFVKIIQTK